MTNEEYLRTLVNRYGLAVVMAWRQYAQLLVKLGARNVKVYPIIQL